MDECSMCDVGTLMLAVILDGHTVSVLNTVAVRGFARVGVSKSMSAQQICVVLEDTFSIGGLSFCEGQLYVFCPGSFVYF
jgi:hypothetical protein